MLALKPPVCSFAVTVDRDRQVILVQTPKGEQAVMKKAIAKSRQYEMIHEACVHPCLTASSPHS